jgi:hypothetical protein
MISCWIALRNPFRAKDFRMLGIQEGSLTKHKRWEIQLSYYAFHWFEFKLDLNWRQTDHAGPWIELNILGLTLDARIYDTRQWSDETNNWA